MWARNCLLNRLLFEFWKLECWVWGSLQWKCSTLYVETKIIRQYFYFSGKDFDQECQFGKQNREGREKFVDEGFRKSLFWTSWGFYPVWGKCKFPTGKWKYCLTWASFVRKQKWPDRNFKMLKPYAKRELGFGFVEKQKEKNTFPNTCKMASNYWRNRRRS